MGTKTYYLEDTPNRMFVSVSAGTNVLKILRGHIGKPCLVFELTSPRTDIIMRVFDRVRTRFSDNGYKAILPTEEIIEGSKAGLLRTDDIKANSAYAKFMKMGTIPWKKPDESILAFHFPDGLTYHDDLDMTLLSDTLVIDGVIIEGDVKIDGVLSELGDTSPDVLLILGNVKTKSLAKQSSHIVIEGNLVVEQTVFGDYNDGSLEILGDVSGEAFIANDHSMYAKGEYCIFHEGFYDNGTADWLAPELMTINDEEDRYLDVKKLLGYIFEGKTALRHGLKFVQNTKEEPKPAEEKPLERKSIFNPDLMEKINAFAMVNDNMGMTHCLVDWPDRDEGWRQLVVSRLGAPSCSQEEKEMLKSCLEDSKPSK